MNEIAVAPAARTEHLTPPNMVSIPGGTFRTGSDKYYPEEAPVHCVTVSGFWIDRTPVYGLYDMIGNMWEWTADWWSRRHEADAPKACCDPENPRGGTAASCDACQPRIKIPRKVIKGGSRSVRAELLPPLSPGCAPCGSSGYVHEPRRIPMCA